jgi:alkanesulfonate monooxygenase SsuD/methylene tetrahydromethanopterin reductase-like flavin-dependent oxidoreductase (luciferase family)
MDRPRSLGVGVTIAAYPEGAPPAAWWWQFAERAEALGFDSLWAGERFAARTRRIRLGTAIYSCPSATRS